VLGLRVVECGKIAGPVTIQMEALMPTISSLRTTLPVQARNTVPPPKFAPIDISKWADLGYGDKVDVAKLLGGTPKFVDWRIKGGDFRLFDKNHYNSKLYDSGMSVAAIKSLRAELDSEGSNQELRAADFDISGVARLYDSKKKLIGFMVTASDKNGIIGGNVFVPVRGGKADSVWGS
jgi:hypothetical protein